MDLTMFSIPTPVAFALIAVIGYFIGRRSRRRSQLETDQARRELKRAKAVAAELETIAVAPESQRQGLGKSLFQALAAELKAAGVGELQLEVRASNRPAQSFYRALGFVETGRRKAYYADPIEDAVLMGLRFADGLS